MRAGLQGKTSWFEDSTCMAFVFVRAPVERVASVFGPAVLPPESWIEVDDATTLQGLASVWYVLPTS